MSVLAWIGLVVAFAPRIPLERLRAPNRRRPVGEEDVLAVARLLSIALSAGLPLPAALAYAADEVEGPVEEELRSLLRRSRVRGTALALVETAGPLAELATRLARAQVTGAPMAEAVAAFVRSRRAELRGRALERTRTLPVKLIVPVSLLLLPGFLALVVGPTVVTQLGDLLGPVTAP